MGRTQDYVLLRAGSWDEIWRIQRRRAIAGGSMVFTPDGRYLAVSIAHEIVSIHDVATGEQVVQLEARASAASAA